MTHSREESHGSCPLCTLDMDVEVRRSDTISAGKSKSKGRLSQVEITHRLEAEDIVEFLPLMKEYLEDRGYGELWVTVAPVAEGQLPKGYSKMQERWANVVGYKYGNQVKYVATSTSAQDTIETLRNEGYGE